MSEVQFLPMILDPLVRGKADTPAEMPGPFSLPTAMPRCHSSN